MAGSTPPTHPCLHRIALGAIVAVTLLVLVLRVLRSGSDDYDDDEYDDDDDDAPGPPARLRDDGAAPGPAARAGSSGRLQVLGQHRRRQACSGHRAEETEEPVAEEPPNPSTAWTKTAEWYEDEAGTWRGLWRDDWHE